MHDDFQTCTSPSSFNHLCASSINRVDEILLVVYSFVHVLCPIIPFSRSLICTCDIFRAQRQLSSRRALKGSFVRGRPAPLELTSYQPAMKSSRSMRTVRSVRPTSVELSWTDEWMCAINLPDMTWRSVRVPQLVTELSLDRCACDLPLQAHQIVAPPKFSRTLDTLWSIYSREN